MPRACTAARAELTIEGGWMHLEGVPEIGWRGAICGHDAVITSRVAIAISTAVAGVAEAVTSAFPCSITRTMTVAYLPSVYG